MKAPAFAYVKPRTLADVFELLERYGDAAKLLAGGQSLMPALNMRLAAPAVLVDVNDLPDLDGISVHGETLRIGALARHRTVERSEMIAQHAPLVAQAMPHVAHAAIRNRGTFGGSIAFADPAAELPACAVALDACFVLASRAGERRVDARKFFTGLYTTELGAQEVLVAGEFPVRESGERCAFIELARRHGDYAVAGVAARCRYGERGFADVSLVFFGVAATPVLARKAAAVMEGQRYSKDLAAAVQESLARDLHPTGDLYHTSETKLHLARVLTGRAIAKLAEEA